MWYRGGEELLWCALCSVDHSCSGWRSFWHRKYIVLCNASTHIFQSAPWMSRFCTLLCQVLYQPSLLIPVAELIATPASKQVFFIIISGGMHEPNMYQESQSCIWGVFILRATSDGWKPTGGSQKVEVMIGWNIVFVPLIIQTTGMEELHEGWVTLTFEVRC
jgi:hypothetical protein